MIELVCCEQTILKEIEDKAFKRLDIAKTYALAIKSSEFDSVDWAKVNAAIIDRWSRRSLEYIKDQAWSGRCWEKRPSLAVKTF